MTAARRTVAVATVATLLLAGTARSASAYVRSTVQAKDSSGNPVGSPVPVVWSGGCVFMTMFPQDFAGSASTNMSFDEVVAAVDAATSAWSASGPMNDCTYLTFNVTPSTDPTPRANHTDYKNWLVFRTATWCALDDAGNCSTDPKLELAYDPLALALTTVSASPHTGEIKDVDVEVNAHQRLWGDLVAHPELLDENPESQDLQNALTHEMGHLIGLDHTCYPPGAAQIPVDENGNPVPDCPEASAEVRATTMFPSADPGEVDKRTLEADDRMGLCDLYNVANDPHVCSPVSAPSSGGCSCAVRSGSASAASVVAAAMLALAISRRRSRRRSR